MDCLALALRELEGARKQLLFFEAEELLRFQLMFAGPCARQEAEVKHDDVLAARVKPVEYGRKIVQSIVIANHHQSASRPHAKRFGSEVVARLQVKLIELGVSGGALAGHSFGNSEDGEE